MGASDPTGQTFMPPGTNPPDEVVHAYAVGELKDALEALPQADQLAGRILEIVNRG